METMNLIVDMDGTVHEAPCARGQKIVDRELLSEFYRIASPYKEIVDELKTYDRSCTGILVITGRVEGDDVVTHKWIERHIGWRRNQFFISYVGYRSREAYVGAKIDEIYNSIRTLPSEAFVYDDDDEILDGVEEKVREYNSCFQNAVKFDNVTMVLVRGGKAWRRTIRIRREP